MHGDPVPRDVDAPGDPHVFMARDVIEKARERRRAPRAPDQPRVQSDRQHLRRVQTARIAFGVERVERVAQIREELVAAVEALGGGERMSFESSV